MTVLPKLRSAGSTLAASTLAMWGLPAGSPFRRQGVRYDATLKFPADARLPARTTLLRPGTEYPAIVQLARSDSGLQLDTFCIKIPDVYGAGRDQDFLLVSSVDGAPVHHLAVPSESAGSRVYSSLWLYAAGGRPLLFGVLPRSGDIVGAGGVVPFAAGGPLSRFHRIGDLSLGDRRSDTDADDVVFDARHDGGRLRALPPTRFYRQRS